MAAKAAADLLPALLSKSRIAQIGVPLCSQSTACWGRSSGCPKAFESWGMDGKCHKEVGTTGVIELAHGCGAHPLSCCSWGHHGSGHCLYTSLQADVPQLYEKADGAASSA